LVPSNPGTPALPALDRPGVTRMLLTPPPPPPPTMPPLTQLLLLDEATMPPGAKLLPPPPPPPPPTPLPPLPLLVPNVVPQDGHARTGRPTVDHPQGHELA
jgi:hypothetical protein